jgi:ABC-type sugar transport system ATPase subunit
LIKPRTERKPLNDSVVVGVRPEDISVSKDETKGEIKVSISLVEPAGSFNWVVFGWNNLSLRGVASVEEGFQTGDRGFMRFPSHRAILFEKNTGERL